jgi:OOP family OmpA-OmpF porin
MTIRFVAASVVALAAVPALAQRAPVSPVPSVAAYLCTFAGKCDGAETKGFRLARSGGGDAADAGASAAAGTAARRSPRNGATARVPYRAPSSRRAYTAGETRRANIGAAGAVAVARPASVAGARRADLMIGFELNSDRLSAVGRESARIFAQSLLMPELRNKRFLIEGHTDERGGQGINMPLSARRAPATDAGRATATAPAAPMFARRVSPAV